MREATDPFCWVNAVSAVNAVHDVNVVNVDVGTVVSALTTFTLLNVLQCAHGYCVIMRTLLRLVFNVDAVADADVVDAVYSVNVPQNVFYVGFNVVNAAVAKCSRCC